MIEPSTDHSQTASADDRKGSVDLWLKVLGTFFAGFALIVGTVQYVLTSDRESRKPFLERQIALYVETTAITGALANAKDPQSFDKSKVDRFWNLYWGELGLVEDAAVSDAMVKYGDMLTASLEERDQEKFGQRQVCLQRASLNVAHVMATSLERTWHQRDLPSPVPIPADCS